MRRQLAAACVVFTLAANGGVAAAEEKDLPQIPQALKAGQQCTATSGKTVTDVPWQLPYLGADRVWPMSRGNGVQVAVVDTGVDQSVVPGDVSGEAGADCVGHGTVLASLIAYKSAKDGGLSGLAPGARVLAVRGTDKTGAATAASIATGIDAAVGAGSRIICVGAVTADGAPVLREAVDRAIAAGALVVAAAGPDVTSAGNVPPGPYFPAALPGVLSVTAIGPDGKTSGKPEIKIVHGTLAAPGLLVMGTGPGGGQVVGVGPAFAAAQVAAAAALVKSYRPESSAGELARRLRGTAYPQSGADVIDPLAAIMAGTAGGAVAARREPLVVKALPDFGATRGAAWAMAGGVVLLVCLLGALAVVVPRGRRRGWRPGPAKS
ncbi:S8 family serine peptidase [Lentzea jiangxiensis]|uniref:Subtilase family protein n=1 Tax=Lentzea jiangxiensis TaxID=641025 RepID=A0A1H0X5I3_9PSEU|nr:S8 family serine peptidase [Lentzea jiangxiensis]SDP98211.1 Subtilase family protein [Lentzea jiangxiensis]